MELGIRILEKICISPEKTNSLSTDSELHRNALKHLKKKYHMLINLHKTCIHAIHLHKRRMPSISQSDKSKSLSRYVRPYTIRIKSTSSLISHCLSLQILLFWLSGSPWQGPAWEGVSASQRTEELETFLVVTTWGGVMGALMKQRSGVQVNPDKAQDNHPDQNTHKSEVEKPYSRRSTNCSPNMASNHDFHFVAIIPPYQGGIIASLSSSQFNPLFEILQSRHLKEAYAEHTRLSL